MPAQFHIRAGRLLDLQAGPSAFSEPIAENSTPHALEAARQDRTAARVTCAPAISI